MIGMALVDLDGRWLTTNPAFPALLGYSEAELLAAPFRSFLALDERDDDLTTLDRLRDSGEEHAYTLEQRSLHKDGRVLWLLYSIALVRGDAGAPAYFIVQAQDITARKVAAEAQLVVQAQYARSNQALQEFASIAAHDLQEPLRKIQAFGDRLRLRHGTALGTEGQDYLARMQGAAARMQRLIGDLLALSRISATTQPFEPVDLNVVAGEVLRDLETRLEQTCGHVTVGDLPVIEADPTQMRQLFQNLLGNALKFHRPDHPPVIRLEGRLRPVGTGELGGDIAGRNVCELVVTDEGIGFDAQYGERIFGVFQRLHGRSEYEGTGIGLAICRTIIERHGGTIVATSAPARGATFTINLPLRQVRPRGANHDG
jgi:PAS domain S-box-containing protein